MNKSITISHIKNRLFTLASATHIVQSYHVTEATAFSVASTQINLGKINQASSPYAWHTSLSQIESTLTQLGNTAVTAIRVSVDGVTINELKTKEDILNSLRIAEVRIESSTMVKVLSDEEVVDVKQEVTAQLELQPLINKLLARDLHTLSLTDCKRTKSLLNSVAK